LLRGISNSSNCSLVSFNDSPPALRVFKWSKEIMIAVSGVTSTFTNWYKADKPDKLMLKPNSLGHQSSPSFRLKSVVTAARHTFAIE
jgi:hypothetical protein